MHQRGLFFLNVAERGWELFVSCSYWTGHTETLAHISLSNLDQKERQNAAKIREEFRFVWGCDTFPRRVTKHGTKNSNGGFAGLPIEVDADIQRLLSDRVSYRR
jgi:hypothetical protein